MTQEGCDRLSLTWKVDIIEDPHALIVYFPVWPPHLPSVWPLPLGLVWISAPHPACFMKSSHQESAINWKLRKLIYGIRLLLKWVVKEMMERLHRWERGTSVLSKLLWYLLNLYISDKENGFILSINNLAVLGLFFSWKNMSRCLFYCNFILAKLWDV